MTTFVTLSCYPTSEVVSWMQVSNWDYVKIFANRVTAICACVDVSNFNHRTWKCFYWTFDQIMKIWSKNSNCFWRHKQYVNCISKKWKISTKWNAQRFIWPLPSCLRVNNPRFMVKATLVLAISVLKKLSVYEKYMNHFLMINLE